MSERLWQRTEVRGLFDCWEWRGCTDRKGYGRIKHGGNIPAHRVAWELAHGRIPSGLLVCHACDNRLCVNPAHLFLGTIADNNRDMAAKGRAARQRGEANGRARLTRDQVALIRATTGPVGRVAERYGVGETTVRDIRSGRAWAEEAS